MNLASDNVVGASRPVLDALIAANDGAEPAYGSDGWTAKAEAMLAKTFEHDVTVFLVATGTGANALALSALTPPWGAVFCHAEAHVIDDECGAPEMFTDGAKLVGVPGVNGKMTVNALKEVLERFPRGVVKTVQPSALSISQVTEAGTLYTLDEIRALADVARANGLGVHLDGARFGNAMVALNATPAEMTWKAGVDVVSFGATKNGCMACEAVIFFDKEKAANFEFRRKRSGHTLSKGRLLGAQMVGYLEGDHWIANAQHANAMARQLSTGLARLPGVQLAWPTEANEVFVIVPKSLHSALTANGFRAAAWSSDSVPSDVAIGPDDIFLRFVTSFATDVEAIDRLLSIASGTIATAAAE